MRSFLNAILSFINSESLTDEEFETIEITVQDYSLSTYLELKNILETREAVSTQLEKLSYYFKAKGLEISDSDSSYTPVSNIFIGGSLE